MSKTTIDGLTVRTSNSTRRANPNASSRRVVGGKLMTDIGPVRRRTAITKTATQTKRTAQAKSTQRASRMDTDFLGPVVGFGLDEPIRKEKPEEVADDADWSDLLAQLDNSSHDKTTAEDFLDEEEEEKPKPKKKTKAKTKKKRHVVRNVLLVFLALIIAGGVWLYFWGDGLISRLTNGNSGLIGTIWSLVSEEMVPFETDENGRTNILVFGTEGYNMEGTTDYENRVSDKTHDGAQLTDSIMVISVDQETKDVALLSLPRDLKVPKACYAGKVNEVFTCNNQNGQNEDAGARALMGQLSQVLGIDFQYWAHVNWASLTDIVDAVGGITVTLDEDINDYYYTEVVIKAGVPTRLTGLQAVALARARHGTQGGDFTRGNSQQKIVEGIVQELVSGGVDLTEALNLINILGDNLRSNFSTDNIKAAAKLAAGFNMANIRNVPLVDYANNIYYVKTGMINDISYVLPNTTSPNDYSKIHGYVAKMFASNPAVREGAGIAIFNAAGVAGVAGAEQNSLEGDGYTVYSIGDATEEDCTEKYCLYSLNEEMPGTRAALEKRYGVVARSASELPTDIATGYADFVVIIGQGEEAAE